MNKCYFFLLISWRVLFPFFYRILQGGKIWFGLQEPRIWSLKMGKCHCIDWGDVLQLPVYTVGEIQNCWCIEGINVFTRHGKEYLARYWNALFINPMHPDINRHYSSCIFLYISFDTDKRDSFNDQSFLGRWSFPLFTSLHQFSNHILYTDTLLCTFALVLVRRINLTIKASKAGDHFFYSHHDLTE